jgi:hypothetical protein
MFNNPALTLAIATVILIGVIIYIVLTQRNLKANAQRIKEEFGEPGERDLAIAQLTESEGEPGSGWNAGPADAGAQLDGKIAQLQQLLQGADERIARLENAIQRAERLGGNQPPVA